MGDKGKKEFAIDVKDDVVRGSIVLQDGKLVWPPPQLEVPSPPKPKAIVKPPEQSPFSAAAWGTGLTTGILLHVMEQDSKLTLFLIHLQSFASNIFFFPLAN